MRAMILHLFAPDCGRYWFGGAYEMEMSKEKRWYDYDMCSWLAVNEYNLRYNKVCLLNLPRPHNNIIAYLYTLIYIDADV